MIDFIRRKVLANSNKSKNAPHIFIILCVYAILTSSYRASYGNLHDTLVRIGISVLIVASYVFFERSSLSKKIVAVAAPTTIIGLIAFGSLYIYGDFLFFIYSIGTGIISLTYTTLRSYAKFIVLSSSAYIVILVVFGLSLLGDAFTMVHNYFFFVASIVLKLLLYVFFKMHLRVLDELTVARNEANQAALAKGAFLSNMSHEIRTPMNAIIGMAAIGKSSDDIQRTYYALDKISDAGNHLLSIINNVLDMSKIESGNFTLSHAEFHVKRIINLVTNLVSLSVDEKKQRLSVSLDKNIPPVLIGDDQRLAQVIANILGNAVKFTPEYGQVNLKARLLGEKDGLCTVQIEITDSGIGMSPEQQRNIFQPFHQAESDTSRKFGGTGLGLSISKSIVDMMGGKIWVESEMGKGTTFAFTVQLRRANASAPIAEKISTEAAFHGKRILVVEDIEINREIVTSLLEPTGAIITCAENGTEALRLFGESPHAYDIIFMDVQMPEMDGFEATRRIRALDESKAGTVPIIAMTANVFREDIEKCLDAGMNGHIGKPLNINEVFDAMRKYLD